MTDAVMDRAHRRRPLSGRDPRESHRTATPLELLYDLTFVVAFGTAANELAHYVADGHYRAALVGFCFAAFSVSWAWIHHTWFASAYDTDDWVCRLATMVQMVGVIILALGLQEMFASIDHGDTLDNRVMVLGYVVMRVSMIFLWTQAARHDQGRSAAAHTYIWTLGLAQLGWAGLVFLDFSVPVTFLFAGVLLLVELSGPVIAARRTGGTPWHAHHIAERYGLLVIITLGEGIIGTVASLNAVVHADEGWTVNAALVAVAGVALTFGLWWMYFAIPWAELLHVYRARAFPFGYLHIVIFGALAASGGGLHVAALFLEEQSAIGPVGVVLSVVIPVATFGLTLYGLYALMVRQGDPFHLVLLAGTAVALALPVVLASAGVDMAVCLVVLVLAPTVTVVGYEAIGHRHLERVLEQATESGGLHS